jgi:hypothetical protein
VGRDAAGDERVGQGVDDGRRTEVGADGAAERAPLGDDRADGPGGKPAFDIG